MNISEALELKSSKAKSDNSLGGKGDRTRFQVGVELLSGVDVLLRKPRNEGGDGPEAARYGQR